jgi:hypothetical protein
MKKFCNVSLRGARINLAARVSQKNVGAASSRDRFFPTAAFIAAGSRSHEKRAVDYAPVIPDLIRDPE